MKEKPRLMLIDGHAMAYRAYFATPPLTAPNGEPSNATFGFASMLLKVIAEFRPDYVIATFDSGRTFRHEEYPEYKATRAKMPDDLRVQVERIQSLTETMGIPVKTLEGFEADDLLGTLSHLASEKGLETLIVTGDSDTLQLVTESVQVVMPRRTMSDTRLYDMAAVREQYGLDPRQLIEYKALMGDTSDNIPGVRGVGEKTARRLIGQYGSVDGVYAHLDEIKEARYRTALEKGHEDALLSRHLVTIVCDLDVDLSLEDARWGVFDRVQLMDMLRELGFHSLLDRLPTDAVTPGEQLSLFATPASTTSDEPRVFGDYTIVDTPALLEKLVSRLREVDLIGLDTETTGVEHMLCRLVGISIATGQGEAWYVPVGHVAATGEAQLALDSVTHALGPFLADPAKGKVLHNAKFDLIVLERHGMPVRGLCDDTMLAAWLLSPTGRGISLREQAFQRLSIEMTDTSELIGRGRTQTTMDKVSINAVGMYACADADMTLRLDSVLHTELDERQQGALYADVEVPLVPVLKDMEMHGVLVDVPYLKEMSRSVGQQIAELERGIHALAGHPFNLNSPKQLGEVLFQELNLPVVRRTKSGPSTDAAVLDQLKDAHPIVAQLLEFRGLDKLRGTYIDTLPRLVNPHTGRVHTSFHQTGTSTGRLSSSDPNLQNIPVRDEMGRHVRRAFVAPPGHQLLGCDYSQVELRLLAHVSEDPEMIAAFERGEDVHATTAAAIYNLPLSEVGYEQRSLAKAINFGLMYGMSSFGLASRTNLTPEQAAEFIKAYFSRFAGVRKYLDETIALARRQGYVETIMGRRRYFPELAQRSVNPAVRNAAERAAVNMPIQGSAADILKVAMIRLYRELRSGKLDAHMILQVHDELVLEVADDDVDEARALLVETMSHAVDLRVPLQVEVSIGRNWMEMKQL
ncbi:MAG: DNA polymerase I [Anaerolineae bacterium]|jgi:DNA polymerase-1|nr:DNA polymerase I [Chloroflexota bacterium]